MDADAAARSTLTIDELVLDGVAPGDPPVAQAVEHAVAQALAAQRGVSPSGAELLAVSAAPRARGSAARSRTPSRRRRRDEARDLAALPDAGGVALRPPIWRDRPHTRADRETSTLDAATRAPDERRLGHDFSNVRIHAGAGGAAAAHAERAEAFAVGEDVAFAAGAFAPGTPHGDALIAHELTHVAQQRVGATATAGAHAGAATAEREASSATVTQLSPRPTMIHRQPAPPAGISQADLNTKLKALLGHDVTLTVGDRARQTRELGGPAAKRALPDTWASWDPGTNADLFDQIATAFADVQREVGGLPDITEIVFYEVHYGFDDQDNVVTDPNAAASIRRRQLNIYKTALFPTSVGAGGSSFSVPGVHFAGARSTAKADAATATAQRPESQRRSVAHELGHGIEARTGDLIAFEAAVGWVSVSAGGKQLFDIQDPKVKAAIKKATDPPASARITKADWNSGKHKEQPMRAYAVTTSEEDFADSLAAWIYARDVLKLRSPARFKFFEDHKGAAAGWDKKLVPPGGTPATAAPAAPAGGAK